MGVPTRFFIGANRTKIIINRLCAAGLVRFLRSALSWLAVLGLDGSPSACSLKRGAWSPTKSTKRSTSLFAKASVQGGLDPNKISDLGADFGIIVR